MKFLEDYFHTIYSFLYVGILWVYRTRIRLALYQRVKAVSLYHNMLQLVTYLVYLILISKGLPHASLFVPSIYLYGRNLLSFFQVTYMISSYELFNWRIVCRSSTMFIQSTSVFVTTQHEHAYKHCENGKITPGTYAYVMCGSSCTSYIFLICISFRILFTE